MTEMTEITFRVPTEALRETRFGYTAVEYRDAADETPHTWGKLSSLASAAFVEAKEALSLPRVPVTKDTKWGQKIAKPSVAGQGQLDYATFIALNPEDNVEGDFYLIVEDDYYALPAQLDRGWFEVHDEPKPEPERVPVKVGQIRKSPDGKRLVVWATDDDEARLAHEGFAWTFEPLDAVEQWEVVEPEPEPVRVPVEVGQRRRTPNGSIVIIIKVGLGKALAPYVEFSWGKGDHSFRSQDEVETWEVVE